MEVLKSTGFYRPIDKKKLKLSEVAQSGALNLRLAALVRTRLTVNPSPRVNNHCTVHFTEMRFASFLSGAFITAIVVNPPEKKLAKRTSVHLCKCALRTHKDAF